MAIAITMRSTAREMLATAGHVLWMIRTATRSAPTPLSEHDDHVLMARLARGDGDALSDLYDRYASTVLGLTLRIVGDHALAEEVLQESFWRLWQTADGYRPDRGSVAGWLFGIARNQAIDVYRKRNARPQPGRDAPADDWSAATIDPHSDTAEDALRLEHHGRVRVALAALPEAQRQVIEMAYFQGLTRAEIAAETGEPLGTIHTRARLALTKLRESLGEGGALRVGGDA